MKRFKQAVLSLTLALLLAAPAVNANFGWDYPDGSFAQVIAVGGTGHAFVFGDFAGSGDLDIFVLNSTHSSTPLFAFLVAGGTPLSGAYALWLDFRGFSGVFLRYDVYVDQGFGFFYTTTVFL
jgi:hypothetical protein